VFNTVDPFAWEQQKQHCRYMFSDSAPQSECRPDWIPETDR
jgi:hypothetical protein